MKKSYLIRPTFLNLSTINFVLCFVGFQLVTSALLPSMSENESITYSVTIPYRALTLGIFFLIIILNIRKFPKSIPSALLIFLFFWVAWIIRMFYDIFICPVINISGTSQLWLYAFGICLPAIFSIILSYNYIDLEKAFWWILYLCALILVLILYSNQTLQLSSNEIKGRINANVAISSISFGHLGAMSILLGLFSLIKQKLSLIKKMVSIILIFLGVFCMLRAGSRSPILALFVVLLFWLFSRKNFLWGILLLIVVFVLIIIFMDPILNFMGNISPIIESRLREAIYLGNSSGRDTYYSKAFEAFLDSPLIGKQFAIFFPDGNFDYSHNIILDALMGLGIVGGIMVVYILSAALIKSYHLIKSDDPHFWICLLLIQQILFNMLSGAFYYNQLLCVLLTLLFLYKRENVDINYYKIL